MPLAVKGSAKAAEAHILNTCPAARFNTLLYVNLTDEPLLQKTSCHGNSSESEVCDLKSHFFYVLGA